MKVTIERLSRAERDRAAKVKSARRFRRRLVRMFGSPSDVWNPLWANDGGGYWWMGSKWVDDPDGDIITPANRMPQKWVPGPVIEGGRVLLDAIDQRIKELEDPCP